MKTKTFIKENCINCHFLDEITHKYTEDGEYIGLDCSTVDNDQRERLKVNDLLNRKFRLKCDFGVWDERLTGNEKRRETLNINRNDYCFFWPYKEGMLAQAAKILQKREAENKETNRNLRLTQIGLGIAVVAIAVDAVIGIAELILNR